MKLTREIFLSSIKSGVLTLLFALPLNATKQEIWYDSEGNPILAKDKTTGRMRVITMEELAVMKRIEEKVVLPTAVVETEKPVVEKLDNPILAPSPLLANEDSVIPRLLSPKISTGNRYYSGRNNHYYSGSYYSIYPYISRSVIPRFSNNGYYRPARYYRPQYNSNHRGNSGYNRSYNNRSNGFSFRYSRSGLNIRARF